MRNLMNYIKKNVIFVSILSIFLVIIMGIGVFYMLQNTDTKDNQEEKPTINEEDKKQKTSIASFGGQFGGEDSIALNWSLSETSAKVQRLELYHDKTIIADVSNLMRYELPLSTYQLTTGKNYFTLKAYLSDGTVVTKKADVIVDYVLHASNTVTPTEGGYLLNFNYRYGTANPVGIPSISFTYGAKGNASAATITYRDTTTSLVDNLFTQANTTYFLDTSKLADGTYALNIRYFFKNVDESYDYTIEFTVNKNVPPSTPNDNNQEETKPDEQPTEEAKATNSEPQA